MVFDAMRTFVLAGLLSVCVLHGVEGALQRAHAPSRPTAAAPVVGVLWDVTDFGAVGNGVTDNTAPFAAALAAASAAGGGTVMVPAGRYL